MSLLDLFRRGSRSAPVARDRLRGLIAQERALSGRADLVRVLQQEILAVIARHVAIDDDKVAIRLDRRAQASTLEIDIEIPDAALSAASRN